MIVVLRNRTEKYFITFKCNSGESNTWPSAVRPWSFPSRMERGFLELLTNPCIVIKGQRKLDWLSQHENLHLSVQLLMSRDQYWTSYELTSSEQDTCAFNSASMDCRVTWVVPLFFLRSRDSNGGNFKSRDSILRFSDRPINLQQYALSK